MLTFFYGGTGTGKSYAMMDKIKQAAENGRKVCVIVPDQFTFEYEHMLYNHLGCALFNSGNTEVWSFSRLAADIFRCTKAPEGMGADSTVKTAVMYKVIRLISEREGLLFFDKQAKRASFANTALTMLSELIHSGVTPEILGEILKTAPDNMRDKLTDLFLIYSEYSSELAALGMRDILLDARLAADMAEQNGYFNDMCLFMDEFKSFTGDQYNMIRVMLSQCAELTVCMTSDDIGKGGFGPFTAVNETCAGLSSIAAELGKKINKVKFDDNKRYKSEELFELSKNLLRLPSKAYNGDGGNITLVTAPDIYGECDYICAAICELTAADSSLRYSDIAVLSRAMNDDISVLAPHFERYNIPYYSDKKRPAGHKPLMLMVTAALELAAEKKPSTEVLLRYAKTGLTQVSEEDIAYLENYCYTWDIDGSMWQSEFPDEKAEDIRLRLLTPINSLKKACSGKTGAQICDALRSFISETGAEEKLLSFEGKYITEAESAAQIRENQWLCSQLDEIFASLEQALTEKISLSDFREIFMLSAEKITLAAPPDALDGVIAQQSDLARLTNPKIVFVMHANDGIFPFITGESSTFSEREREFFKKSDYDLSGSMKKRLAEERFNAFKALCSPSHRLFVSYSEADISGASVYPSPYIEKISACIPNCKRINTSDLDMLYFCRTPQSAYAAASQNFDPSDPDFITVKTELCKDPLYAKKFSYIDRIDLSTAHKIADKKLMKKLYGDTLELSASRFEDFSKCPFMYFCKTGLKLYPLPKMDLNPINQGNIMHMCMKDIFEKNRGEKFLNMTTDDLTASIKKSVDSYIAKNLSGKFAKKKSFGFYLDIMNDTLLTALTHMQEEQRVSRFVPSDFEYPVGVKGSVKNSTVTPVIIECGEGLKVNFTGTADRVDEFTDENGVIYIRILDYKTGVKDFMKEQLALGINMQMFFYLFALTDEKGGRYGGCVPAGALYIPVKYPKSADDRMADETSAAKCIDDTMKMQGAVLDSPLIINAMEEDCQGRFIPVTFKKDGTVSAKSSVIDSGTMEKIKALAIKQIEDMGRAVYSGDFPASPLESKKYKCTIPCGFCDYREICGNYPDPVPRDISDIDFETNGEKE